MPETAPPRRQPARGKSRDGTIPKRGHRLSIRIYLASGGWIGPGKINLLERIAETGSISAAARVMGMSYRRAWELVEQMNRLGEKLVASAPGGPSGGGASLTPAGTDVLTAYRAIEKLANQAAAKQLAAIRRRCGAG